MLWLLGLLLPAASALAADATPHARPEPWRVVLIRSWDSQYAANIMRERALLETMMQSAPRLIEIYTEEVDAVRFPSGEPPEFVSYLRAKYGGRHTDLVIATGNEPLEFAARHRDSIWPGAPILFNGVPTGTLPPELPPRTTGVTMTLDLEGTLRFGLALVPDARVVHFVAGVSEFDQTFAELAHEAARAFEGRLEARFISGLSRADTLAALEKVEPRSLVVYLSMLRDGTGQLAGPGSDTVSQVAAHSAAPVLSAVYTQFGRGPVGGSSARFDVHGAVAGRIARRLLEGENPDAIPVMADPRPSCLVDWRTLARWKLQEARIPGDCEITERPVSAWDAYLRPVVALGSIILLQAALIWALWAQSRRRRVAEAEAQRRRTEIAHVARLSVMGVVTASIAHEINQPLGAILSNADAADLMIRNGKVDAALLREILADIRSEDLRASEVIRGLRMLLRKREMRNVVLDVNTEVAEALHHVANDAGRRRVRVVPDFAIDLPAVVGDAVHLQQVLINLVVNAMDAMDQIPEFEREVRVETAPRGRGVEIAVADRGSGITPEHASQLFDSFFTTKPDGMGLGLSIVRTIVEAHGGRVWADAGVLRGAVFRVWLPAAGTA
jgi:C4-dicarboxylate-specific signal transduction histidine kinase